MQTFDFPVRHDANHTVQHRVLSANFGDGYIQRAGDGINTKTTSWDLSCTGSLSFIQQVQAFLDAQGGYKAFLWSPPGQAPAMFVCAGYKLQSKGAGIYAMAFTFEQTYHP